MKKSLCILLVLPALAMGCGDTPSDKTCLVEAKIQALAERHHAKLFDLGHSGMCGVVGCEFGEIATPLADQAVKELREIDRGPFPRETKREALVQKIDGQLSQIVLQIRGR